MCFTSVYKIKVRKKGFLSKFLNNMYKKCIKSYNTIKQDLILKLSLKNIFI